jgi:carbon-monoxide dehydrogenase medium subunit
MAGFSYRRPASLDEALALLREAGDDAKLLAGGQSLVPMLSLGLVAPRLLVDVNRLPGLDYARVEDGMEGGAVAVGPLARHRLLERCAPALAAAAPLLPLAAVHIGHQAIRTRGTMLGSLAHGDPAAEWPAVALALGAELRLARAGSERRVAAADFFLGPLTTDLGPEELLVEARWPVAPPRSGAAVEELAYRHGDYAVVGVAAQVSLAADDTIAAAHLGLFGVDATPIRPRAAEELLVGSGPAAFAAAGQAAQAAVDPASDATASAAYRREMAAVFVRRALASAYARARDASQ